MEDHFLNFQLSFFIFYYFPKLLYNFVTGKGRKIHQQLIEILLNYRYIYNTIENLQLNFHTIIIDKFFILNHHEILIQHTII